MPRPSSDGRNLSGPARAAIFMLAIGESHACKLLRMMDDEEIRVISQEMACLGKISSDVVEQPARRLRRAHLEHRRLGRHL